jgi:hypothetical protein
MGFLSKFLFFFKPPDLIKLFDKVENESEATYSEVMTAIRAGADVNTRSLNGWTSGKTVLMLATMYNNNLEVVKALLKAGANPNARESRGIIPIAPAFEVDVSMIEGLKKQGVNVHMTDEGGKTVLMNAVIANENPEIIKALVDSGADVNSRDLNGNTVLMYAAMANKNAKIVKMLIEAGAKVNAKNERGEPVLHFARMGKSYEISCIIKSACAKTKC